MRFARSRRALQTIRGQALRKDLAVALTGIETAVERDRTLAGNRLSLMIGLAVGLSNTIPRKARFDLIDGLFDDAIRANVPHQWERIYGFECGPNNDCSKPKDGAKCVRNTSTGACATG